MKKILIAVLLLSLLLALCACGDTGAAEPASATTPAPTAETAPVTVPDENAEEQLTVGTLRQDAEGATYENPLLGFGCRLDTSWYVATKEQLAQLSGVVMDAYEGTGYEEAMRRAQSFFDLYAENPDLPATVNLNFTTLKQQIDPSNEQVLAAMQAELQSGLEAGSMQNVETELRTVSFLGGETKAVHFYALNQGVDYYGLQIYFSTGERFATLTLGTFGEDKTETLLELFYPLS